MPGIQQSEQINRNYPLIVDPSDGTLCIVCLEIQKKSRKVQEEHKTEFERLQIVKKQQQPVQPAETDEDLKKLPKAE